MKFSIIVPVYNVEKYLVKCIDSIINQTFKDFELILIDDGSVDRSPNICDNYLNKYNNIKVVHKKNEGQGAAWMKEGLDLVSGDYVGSIDSDDWVDLDLLERLSKEIERSHPDILVFGYKNVNNLGEQENRLSVESGLFDKNAIKSDILPSLINVGGFQNRNCIYLSRVNKFITRELLLKNRKYYDSRFPYGEDNFWTIPNVLSANSIYVFSDWFPYSYRMNPTSTTHSFHDGLWEKFTELSKVERRIIGDFEKKELCEQQVYNDMVLHAAICINNVMRGKLKRKAAIEEIKKVVNNKDLRRGLKGMNPKICSVYEKLNIFLMKIKAACLIYFIKKIQYAIR